MGLSQAGHSPRASPDRAFSMVAGSIVIKPLPASTNIFLASLKSQNCKKGDIVVVMQVCISDIHLDRVTAYLLDDVYFLPSSLERRYLQRMRLKSKYA